MPQPRDARNAADERFQVLVEHSSDIVFVVDAHGILTFLNHTAADTFGVPVEEALSTPVFRFVHPDDVDAFALTCDGLLAAPETSATETLRFVGTTGGVRTFETVATNRLAVPSVAGLVVNGRDVTERNDYIERLEQSFSAITEAVTTIVEIRDPYTAGHQRQVARLATAIARQLGLPEHTVKGIQVAATLHDIGKIAVPIEILARPGHLTPAELEMVRTHPQTGAHIVTNASFPWPVAEMILQHHERLDGSGYPRGLQGDDILFEARVISVADVVSAMSVHRPYRAGLGIPAAVAEIEANRGLLYDAAVVDACLRVLDQGSAPGLDM
ncbi:MAG: HD domain-containing phosphohydrolase [Acidimicrobiales bacterium]